MLYKPYRKRSVALECLKGCRNPEDARVQYVRVAPYGNTSSRIQSPNIHCQSFAVPAVPVSVEFAD